MRQKLRRVSLNQKNAEFFQAIYYFSFIFLDNTSYKFWNRLPSPHYQCCLQVFGTVCCCKFWLCFSSNILQHWTGRRSLVYFCKVDHSRISMIFSGIKLVSRSFVRDYSKWTRTLWTSEGIWNQHTFKKM